MAKPMRTSPPGFEDLSVDEQVDYLQALWERTAETTGAAPVRNRRREIIRKRLLDLESANGRPVTWDEAHEEILRMLSEG